MKIDRSFGLAAIALLVVGAMGAIASQSLAMGLHNTAGVQAHASVVQAQAPVVQSQSCAQDQSDGTEVSSTGADTDNVDLQCGDQNAPDAQPAAVLDSASSSAQQTLGAENDTGGNVDLQKGDQRGDQSGPDSGGQAP